MSSPPEGKRRSCHPRFASSSTLGASSPLPQATAFSGSDISSPQPQSLQPFRIGSFSPLLHAPQIPSSPPVSEADVAQPSSPLPKVTAAFFRPFGPKREKANDGWSNPINVCELGMDDDYSRCDWGSPPLRTVLDLCSFDSDTSLERLNLDYDEEDGQDGVALSPEQPEQDGANGDSDRTKESKDIANVRPLPSEVFRSRRTSSPTGQRISSTSFNFLASPVGSPASSINEPSSFGFPSPPIGHSYSDISGITGSKRVKFALEPGVPATPFARTLEYFRQFKDKENTPIRPRRNAALPEEIAELAQEAQDNQDENFSTDSEDLDQYREADLAPIDPVMEDGWAGDLIMLGTPMGKFARGRAHDTMAVATNGVRHEDLHEDNDDELKYNLLMPGPLGEHSVATIKTQVPIERLAELLRKATSKVDEDSAELIKVRYMPCMLIASY